MSVCFRFTKCHLQPLQSNDIHNIISNLYSNIPKSIINKLVEFNNQLTNDVIVNKLYGQRGAPWEFNLRDMFRVCDLLTTNRNQNSSILAMCFMSAYQRQNLKFVMCGLRFEIIFL